ncbi:glutathione binding-like protein [Sphingomonas sp.]|uniref:glutathione binding-like protein n=1 Tax=Sphingomonas sp. TaxID=28214 RepID=UPI002DD63EC8|nr:glutathione binding-like protein [Sphingomonas sp.]
MIEVLFAPTPNCWKVTILLEEMGLAYRTTPVDLAGGAQHAPAFVERFANNRVPAIVDRRDPAAPLHLFESGAILWHLARDDARFLPADPARRATTIQWLMWQMAGLGPMLGQHGHFLLYTRERHDYPLDRYRAEALRLYGVLDRQLGSTGAHVAGDDYSIADIACFPWVMTHKKQQIDLAAFPNVAQWYARLRTRPLLQAGLAIGRDTMGGGPPMDDAARARFFGAVER